MKKNLLYGLMSTALVLSVATACSDDKDHPGSQSGTLDLTVDLDVNALNASEGERSRATADEITVDDLALTLTPKSGGQSRTWASINDFDKTEQFPVGDYTLAVSYGDPDVEGFDRPYYYGSTDFRIREDQTTPVAVTAALANAMVKVEASDAFKSYFTEAAFTIQSNNGAVIDYPLEETESAYFKAGEVNVIANVTKPNGVSGSLTVASFEAQPRYSYTVKADINGGAGDATLVISYNDATESVVVEIDLTDELLNAPAPEVNAKGFDPQETYTIVDGLPEGLSPVLDIIARNGLAGIAVTTQSPSLIAAGWPAEIDLMKADAAQQQLLESLGLTARGVYRNPDKLAVVDLSGVVNNIYYVADASTDNKITVVAKDKLGKLAEPVTLSITTLPIEIAIEQPLSPLPTFETSLTVPVKYNGSNIDNVSIFLKNSRGTFSKVDDVKFAKSGDGVYDATFAVPADDKDVVLYAQCKGVASATITIVREKMSFTLSVNANNVFAKSAVLNVLANGQAATSVPKSVKIQVAKSGGNFEEIAYSTLGGDQIKIEGLTAGTDYQARVFYNDEATEAVDFATEQALTLTNSGLESWENNPKTAGSVSADLWSLDGWATLNAVSTSKLNSATQYSGLSSTCREDGGRSGYGALIRSVGYGCTAGSASTGIGAGNTNATNYSQGELFLGSYSEGANYGIDFASRPAALSFWYKYTPVSDDLGYAEITVYDASNNVIATKNIALESATSYTRVNVALDYPAGAAKAAKLSVIFRSTNDVANHLNNTYIPKNSQSNGFLGGVTLTDYFVGSQLYVDDIELVY